MLLRGFSDALMMRSQQAVATGSAQGYLPPEHYDQIFSAHGTIMIFFVAMPFVDRLDELRRAAAARRPRRGVPDAEFGELLADRVGCAAGQHVAGRRRVRAGPAGWPTRRSASSHYSPGVGVDYYLWSLQISGVGTLLTGINFVTTILKTAGAGHELHAHAGVLLDRAGVQPAHRRRFSRCSPPPSRCCCWTAISAFTSSPTTRGGNAMMYINLIWVWGHPEVYILILPAFGVFSEVVATFSGKPLFGYRSMVAATMAICVLSFLVWLHHFFTMGAGANVNAFFGVMTMIIAVPTGVKVFNWLFTMYGGRIRFTTPILWSIGFMVTFVIGGMTGVLPADPACRFPAAQQPVSGRPFPQRGHRRRAVRHVRGLQLLVPQGVRLQLDERWGRRRLLVLAVGFYVAFMPLYALGLMGMTRRMQHYDNVALAALADRGGGRCRRSSWPGLPARSSNSSSRSVTARRRRDLTGDPWNGRTLEWSTTSPPPRLEFRRSAAGRRHRRLLGDEAGASRASSAATPGSTSRSRCRRTAPIGVVMRVLCRRHRLRTDLAHLVDGRAGTCRCLPADPPLRIACVARRKSKFPPKPLLRLPVSASSTREDAMMNTARCLPAELVRSRAG